MNIARYALATLSAMALLFTAACSNLGNGTIDLPIDIGLAYEIEPGIQLVVEPGAKGGYDLRFEGTGVVNDRVEIIENGVRLTSPNTGIIYEITTSPGGKPRIRIVGGGTGRLKVIPPQPETEPSVTIPGPPPAPEE